MRTSFLSASALVVFAFAPTLPLRLDPGRPQDSTEQDKTPLQQAMESLNRGQRGLRKLVSDPVANQQELLDTLTKMEHAVLAALGELPPDPGDEKVPQTERALWHVSYKQTLARLLQAVLSMQYATLQGDVEALGSGYDEISAVKQVGHERFRDL